MAQSACFECMKHQSIQRALAGLDRRRDMRVTLGTHHYIVLSILHRWMREVAAPSASGVLLDFGCGGQPYRTLFEPCVTQYLAADVAAAAGVRLDIRIVPSEPLPLPNESVDTVLSTQVLEHLANPGLYLRECRRVLKTGARLIITVPMQWRHHEVPYDYLRFTRFGIVSLLETAGFEVDVAQPCGGVFALIGQILANALATRGYREGWLMKTLNCAALALDRRYPDYEDTLLWMCLAHALPANS